MSRDIDVGSTDFELLQLIRNIHEQFAWEKFLARYRPYIRRFCISRQLNENEVDEIESQIIYRLLTFFTQKDQEEIFSFRGMLEKLVNNEINRYLRSKITNREKMTSVSDMSVLKNSTGDKELLLRLQNDLEDRLIHLNRVIDKLKRRMEPATWQIYWDYSIMEMKAEDVAAKHGVSVTAVYKYQKRVKEKIREIVKSMGIENRPETVE